MQEMLHDPNQTGGRCQRVDFLLPLLPSNTTTTTTMELTTTRLWGRRGEWGCEGDVSGVWMASSGRHFPPSLYTCLGVPANLSLTCQVVRLTTPPFKHAHGRPALARLTYTHTHPHTHTHTHTHTIFFSLSPPSFHVRQSKNNGLLYFMSMLSVCNFPSFEKTRKTTY